MANRTLYSFNGMTGEAVIYSECDGSELYRATFSPEHGMTQAAEIEKAIRKAERLSAIHTAQKIQAGMFGVIDSCTQF